ncbi:hypothetical protein [Brevibacterium linens]|uniref:hypothetical protein n=1 Tax=Brevibacterium linens TaxID=1703 RepID=UPI003F8A88F8
MPSHLPGTDQASGLVSGIILSSGQQTRDRPAGSVDEQISGSRLGDICLRADEYGPVRP